MPRTKEGIVFEYKNEAISSEIVRKSATKTKDAYYQLKKSRIAFIVGDVIDNDNPLIVKYGEDENRIFLSSSASLLGKKRESRITFSATQDDSNTNQIEVNNIINGLEVAITVSTESLVDGYKLILDSVGTIKQINSSFSLVKDNKTVYRINNLEISSGTGTVLPVDVSIEKNSENKSTVLITTDENKTLTKTATVKFQITEVGQQPIVKMYSQNIERESIDPVNGLFKVGRYVDESRVNKSNSNTLYIEIDPEHIKEVIDLTKVPDFSFTLRLYHFEPTYSTMAKRRSGFVIDTGNTSRRKVVPTAEGELLIDLTNSFRTCLINDDWSNFLVTIASSDPGLYARTGGSQSGISNVLTTDDYIGICDLNYLDETMRPKILFEYKDWQVLEPTTPIIEIDNRKSGVLSLNSFTSDFVFKHYDTSISISKLSIDLFHVYSTDFARSINGGNNVFGMGVGWKTNLHQWLYKTPYDPEKKELK